MASSPSRDRKLTSSVGCCSSLIGGNMRLLVHLGKSAVVGCELYAGAEAATARCNSMQLAK